MKIPYLAEFKIFRRIFSGKPDLRTVCLALTWKTAFDSLLIFLSSFVSLIRILVVSVADNTNSDDSKLKLLWSFGYSCCCIILCIIGGLGVLNKEKRKMNYFLVFVALSTCVALVYNIQYALSDGLCNSIHAVFSGLDVIPVLKSLSNKIPDFVCWRITAFAVGSWSILQQASLAFILDAYLEELEVEIARIAFFEEAKQMELTYHNREETRLARNDWDFPHQTLFKNNINQFEQQEKGLILVNKDSKLVSDREKHNIVIDGVLWNANEGQFLFKQDPIIDSKARENLPTTNVLNVASKAITSLWEHSNNLYSSSVSSSNSDSVAANEVGSVEEGSFKNYGSCGISGENEVHEFPRNVNIYTPFRTSSSSHIAL